MRAFTARYLKRNTLKYIHNNFTLLVDIIFLDVSVYFKPSSAMLYNFHKQYFNPHMLEMVSAFNKE